MHKVIQAMLSMTGRVAMLASLAGQGRMEVTERATLFQYFYCPGRNLLHLFRALFVSTHEYSMVGDESVVTKFGSLLFRITKQRAQKKI